jgi:hypothetical protein
MIIVEPLGPTEVVYLGLTRYGEARRRWKREPGGPCDMIALTIPLVF